MRAVVYDGPGDFSVRTVPTPEPRRGEVLIAVSQVGLCGTDAHIHHGEYGAVFPLIPGHEMTGTVVVLGEGVTRFQVGESVTVNPNIACGRCSYCLSGRVIHCDQPTGMGSSATGFFAEYVCVAETLVYSVEGLPVDVAVFAEPTSCAMHGLEVLQVRPGASALVLGAGPTGLLLAQLIAAGGAASVTVADRLAFKLDTASTLGATRTVLVGRQDPLAQLLAASDDGDGYDIVVEATGTAAVGDMCIPLTRKGGTVLLYGVTGADERLQISPFDILRREITIKGSCAEMTSFGAAIAALRAGRVRSDGIITHRFGLDDYGTALDTLIGDATAHKVLIHP